MDSRGLYDDDIYAWSEQQAAVLRGMAARGGRLPSDLDIEHVAEEIEDVGKSQRDAAESFLRPILSHLIKLAVAPTAQPAKRWRSEIVSLQIELLARLTPSMASRIDMDRLWRFARREARARLDADEVGATSAAFWDVRQSPFSLEALANEDLDLDRLIARLHCLG